MFDANWSASAIHRWLKTRYSDNAGLFAAIPSLDALQRWRKKNAKPCNLIPTSILHELIGKTESSVDVLGYLEALVPLLANRVGAALKIEQSLGGFTTDATDKAVTSFLAAARQLWEVGRDCGLYPSRPIAPALLLGLPLADDVGLRDGEQGAMWEAIWRHRNGTELPEIESPLAKEARLASETAEGEST